jgi:hypothetical protein
MPGWNLMGDNFQPGTLTCVIDGAPQRVTPIPKLFQKNFFAARMARLSGRVRKEFLSTYRDFSGRLGPTSAQKLGCYL